MGGHSQFFQHFFRRTLPDGNDHVFQMITNLHRNAVERPFNGPVKFFLAQLYGHMSTIVPILGTNINDMVYRTNR